MANVLVNDLYLGDIADAIRDKLDVQTTYKPSEMAAAIESISGGSVNNQNKTVHPSSSDQSITADTGYTGLGTVSVKAVTMSNLSASNILEGVTIKIGDADDDDRIASVTGSASGGITPTGTKEITSNGTNIDVYSYAKADVAVPNSYSAGDEGKVVSNGALVAQTSDTVTENDTYDTTLINSLTVNVSGSGGASLASGTYTPSSDVASFAVSVEFEPQYGLVVTDPTEMAHTDSWKNTFAFYDTVDDVFASVTSRYLSSGTSFNSSGGMNLNLATERKFVYSNGTLTFNKPSAYNFVSGVTYTWFAWRGTT